MLTMSLRLCNLKCAYQQFILTTQLEQRNKLIASLLDSLTCVICQKQMEDPVTLVFAFLSTHSST
jgi:hypothetical protein